MTQAVDNYLATIDSARTAIEQATTINEVKDLRDKAEAMRVYMKQSDFGLDGQNRCAALKIRADRKLGAMLAEMPKNGGGRPSENRSRDVTSLSDLGITKMQSSRWQAVASLPEPEFEGHISDTIRSGKELTTSGVIKMAKQRLARSTKEPEQQPQHEDVTDNLQDYIDQGIKFGTVYADPAWRYGNQGTRAATDNHYETMTVDEICELPVSDLVADDAHLHLWTTNAFLFDAPRVMDAWGFTYKSVMLWVKPQMGIGNYWRVSHEFLLFGIRGKCPFRDRSIMSWIQHDRTTHSTKPEAFRKAIERVSPGPYLEMFARIAAPGWSAWGNQVGGSLYAQGGAL